jgi:hypothetical protein
MSRSTISRPQLAFASGSPRHTITHIHHTLFLIAVIVLCMAQTALAVECLDYTTQWHWAGPLEDGITDTAVDGNLIYASIDDSRFAVIDATDTLELAVIGELEMPDGIGAIVCHGELVSAVAGDGLTVIDVSDPTAPALRGHAPIQSYVGGLVAVDGSTVLIVSDRLDVFDIGSNPDEPHAVGSLEYPTGDLTRATGLAAHAGHVFISRAYRDVSWEDEWGGLDVIDVTDPTSPTLIGSLDWNHPANAMTMDPTAPRLFVVGNELYQTTSCGSHYWHMARMIDVSDPTAPLDTYLAVGHVDEFGVLWDVAAVSGLAVVTAEHEHRFIDAESNTGAGRINARGTVRTGGSELLFVRRGDSHLILDCRRGEWLPATSCAPDPPGVDPRPWCVRVLTVNQGVFYSIEQFVDYGISHYRLSVHDTRSGTAARASDISLSGSGSFYQQLEASGERLALCSGSRWHIGDLADPLAPVLSPRLDPSHAIVDVGLTADGLAYVAAGETGLMIYDLDDPSTPQLVGSTATPAPAVGIAFEDSRVYTTHDAAGVRVHDVSDPATPAELGSATLPGESWRIAVSGGHVFVIDRSHRLRVADLSDPQAPVVNEEVVTTGVTDIEIVGRIAYLAAHGAGVMAFDVSDPLSPRAIAGPPLTASVIAADSTFVAASDYRIVYPSCGGFDYPIGHCCFYPTACPYDPTPVTLARFEAVPDGGAIELRWSTSRETDHLGFRIERATNPPPEAFEAIGPELIRNGAAGGRDYAYRDADVEPGHTYAYRLLAIGIGGDVERFGPVLATMPTAEAPRHVRLGATIPNPFRPHHGQLAITYEIPAPGLARVRVFDVSGRLVRGLLDQPQASGRHEMVWDGRGHGGRPLAPGVYFLELEAAGRCSTRRVVLLH